VIEALRSVPTDVPDAYEEILVRIENAQHKDVALEILSWLYYARRPLLMDELREILSVRPGDSDISPDYLDSPEQVIQYCQSLILFEEESGIVRFSHYTVEEFLGNTAGTLSSTVELGKACLKYLMFDEFANGPCPEDSSLERRLTNYRFSCYAAEFWSSYCGGPGEERCDIITDIFRVFGHTSRRESVVQLESSTRRTLAKFYYTKHQTLLHVMVQNGLSTVCRLFLNIGDERLRHSDACQCEDIKAHVTSELDVNARDEYGRTLLHAAVLYDRKDIMEMLLLGNININAQDFYGQTALHIAARLDMEMAVIMLLNGGANINIEDFSGETALDVAFSFGSKDVVSRLTDSNATRGKP
jgi:Ankyrin repeats (3 copies)